MSQANDSQFARTLKWKKERDLRGKTGAVIGARLSLLDALCVCYEPATEDERAMPLACLDCRISVFQLTQGEAER